MLFRSGDGKCGEVGVGEVEADGGLGKIVEAEVSGGKVEGEVRVEKVYGGI